MLLPIANSPRPYAWGSQGQISTLLGLTPTGDAEAELWLGAHPGSPSVILDPARAGGAADLAAWFASAPEQALAGEGDSPLLRDVVSGQPRMPYLLKVLAAGAPLSIQAHPTMAQAIAGFQREAAAGVPIDAGHRNYKDAYHKPEMIVAVSETFDALSGLRDPGESRALLDLLAERLSDFARVSTAASYAGLQAGADLAPILGKVLRMQGSDEAASLVAALAEAAAGILADGDPGRWRLELETIVDLAERYPGDAGVLVAMLLNRVRLRAGEALYLGAGNLHAYLSGLGIELMASSDNVLRGGLTPKHIDVPELLAVADPSPVPVPMLTPEPLADNAVVFAPPVADFRLVQITGPVDGLEVDLAGGPGIALIIDGAFQITGASESGDYHRGEALYATPSEGALRVTGDGAMVVATLGRS